MRRASKFRASPTFIVALAAAAVLAGSGCASSTDSASSSGSGSSGAVATTTDSGNPCDSNSSAYDSSKCGNSSSNGAGQSNTGSGNSTSFCSTHSCIDNFDNGTGYIVQCNDGMWSHSGGRPGACSHHSGESSTTAQDQSAATDPSQTTSAPPAQTQQAPPGSTGTPTACDPNISAGSGTSCQFAENVFAAYAADYKANGQQSDNTITATSSVTRQSYSMHCTTNGVTVNCSGGNNAYVTFSMHAVEIY